MLDIADVVFDGGIVKRYSANVVPVFCNVGLYNAIVALDGGIVTSDGGNVMLVRGIVSVYLGIYYGISDILFQNSRKNFQIAYWVMHGFLILLLAWSAVHSGNISACIHTKPIINSYVLLVIGLFENTL